DGEFTPLDEIEKQAIEKAYFHSDRNAAEAAKLLGISRATMYRKLKQFGYET
ncbi:MAG: sigma-54-dependent Fis family transcriptional regulator, partial [Calditrichia bacterium]|nr:sigma-54-dependent Fis family transcriptional regulator [Calditrichia bacterium]